METPDHENERQPCSASGAEEQPDVGAPLIPAGTTLDSRYRIIRALGRGGMGQVYEAVQLGLERRVAIKVPRIAVEASAGARKRFEREARSMARIDSEHVATIFDFGVGPGGQAYLVMEYLEGRDLRVLLNQEGNLPAPRAVRLIHGVCRGLAAAHERGVIHRDLKPENLFVVTRDGGETCKVLDFGLAKLQRGGRTDLRTVAGVPFGTLHYMSPEQARGDVDVDELADVYGCAAVLYELLTGKRPHTADSPHALLYKIVHESPKWADQVFPYVPAGLAAVVQAGLARNRSERPSSVSAFATLIAPFIGSASNELRGRAQDIVCEESRLGWTNHDTAPAVRPPRLPMLQSVAMIAAGALLGGSGVWWMGAAAFEDSRQELPASAAATGKDFPAATPSAALRADASELVAGEGAGTLPPRAEAGSLATTAAPRAAPRRPISKKDTSFERRNPYD